MTRSTASRQVDAAKADGRHCGGRLCPIRSASEATIPSDLRAAIEANPRARKTSGPWDARTSFRAGVSYQCHEDAGRADEENRYPGGDAGARRDHLSRTADVPYDSVESW